MNITSIRVLSGPNVHSHEPVLVVTLEGIETSAAKATLERTVRELLECAGIAADAEAGARHASVPSENVLVVPYRAERATRYLVHVAVDVVVAAAAGRSYDVEPALAEARRLIARYELGPSTRTIVEAAERRGIPWRRIGDDSIVQLGHGVNLRRIQAATTDRTSTIAVDISCDKQQTKSLLDAASLPVPRGMVVESNDEAIAALREIGAPVVIKPIDGCQGRGVTLNVACDEEVCAAFARADGRRGVLVEEQVPGRNYRVLIVNGVMVAASERLPAHVVGDGVATVAELIATANSDPARGDGHEKPLTKIVLDDDDVRYLAGRGATLQMVPAAGEIVWLRESANLSTGGIAIDVTDRVHPSVCRACERAARVIGLDICGVDLVAEDIGRPLAAGSAAIIEVNAAPGLRMHTFPSQGRSRDVGGAIVEMLFPAGTPSRIPIVTITGTNGKTTVTRLVEYVIATGTGRRVGMTTTDGIWIGGKCVAEGDTTGPRSARTVLGDPSVEVAVLETARGGIVRRGLGYDWSDVAILTNVQPDHFGQDGIESLEDLLAIKSLVAERVRAGGTIVLNADDASLASLPASPAIGSPRRRVVYFSLDHHSDVVRRHRADGGTAYVLHDGWLVEASGASERRIVRAEDMPMTIGATATHQIANLLAAIAGCRAMGVTPEAIARALLRFRSARHNRGRENLFRLPSGGHVLIDYGHNPEAFRAICAMAGRWNGIRVTGIVAVPGDRNDRLIEESGRVAARGFDRIVIVEDNDRRGRRAGEVAALLCQAIKDEAPQRECLVVLDQPSALAGEVACCGADDVVVIFYEAYEPLVELLRHRGAVAVEALPDRVLGRQPQTARAGNGRSTPIARSA